MAMNFKKSYPLEWKIVDKDTLISKRKKVVSAGQKSLSKKNILQYKS